MGRKWGSGIGGWKENFYFTSVGPLSLFANLIPVSFTAKLETVASTWDEWFWDSAFLAEGDYVLFSARRQSSEVVKRPISPVLCHMLNLLLSSGNNSHLDNNGMTHKVVMWIA